MKKRKNQDDSKTIESSNSTIPSNNLPNYGSQEYWEKRYKRNHEYSSIQQTDANDKLSSNDKDEVSPGHEWYFTYKELKSLILPLVLGGRGEHFDEWSDDDDDGNEENEDDENNDGWEEVENENEEQEEKEDVQSNSSNENNEGNDMCLECNDNYEYNYKNNYNTEDLDKKVPPKKILEIGCGDVPLGRDICNDLLHFQSITGGVNAKHVVEQIICFDYSSTVIDLLVQQEQQQRNELNKKVVEKGNNDNNDTDLKVSYDVLDARKLPFQDKEFNLILDKGTLDAMLADKDEGTKNCVQIVCEAGRTLAVGGEWYLIQTINVVQIGITKTSYTSFLFHLYKSQDI